MTEREMQHGKMWDGENLDGWHLSEKLDGCRAFWDGAQMWTRAGNAVAVPEWFRSQLPDTALDGEIWAGRGEFLRASAAVRLGVFDAEISFQVFDAPGAGDWPARLARALAVIDGSDVAAVVPTFAPREHEAVFDLRDEIENAGGEGVIARRPGAAYRAGRSADILKLKDQAEWMLASEMRRRLAALR